MSMPLTVPGKVPRICEGRSVPLVTRLSSGSKCPSSPPMVARSESSPSNAPSPDRRSQPAGGSFVFAPPSCSPGDKSTDDVLLALGDHQRGLDERIDCLEILMGIRNGGSDWNPSANTLSNQLSDIWSQLKEEAALRRRLEESSARQLECFESRLNEAPSVFEKAMADYVLRFEQSSSHAVKAIEVHNQDTLRRIAEVKDTLNKNGDRLDVVEDFCSGIDRSLLSAGTGMPNSGRFSSDSGASLLGSADRKHLEEKTHQDVSSLARKQEEDASSLRKNIEAIIDTNHKAYSLVLEEVNQLARRLEEVIYLRSQAEETLSRQVEELKERSSSRAIAPKSPRAIGKLSDTYLNSQDGLRSPRSTRAEYIDSGLVSIEDVNKMFAMEREERDVSLKHVLASVLAENLNAISELELRVNRRFDEEVQRTSQVGGKSVAMRMPSEQVQSLSAPSTTASAPSIAGSTASRCGPSRSSFNRSQSPPHSPPQSQGPSRASLNRNQSPPQSPLPFQGRSIVSTPSAARQPSPEQASTAARLQLIAPMNLSWARLPRGPAVATAQVRTVSPPCR